MFLSQAWAQEAASGSGAGAGAPDLLLQMAPLILIFVVFYFLMIRPQQKRMREHRDMLGALRRGDRVVTGGGILGQIVKIADDEVTVEIAEGVRVRVLRSSITSVVTKPEPARASRADRSEPANPGSSDAASSEPGSASPSGERRGLTSLFKR